MRQDHDRNLTRNTVPQHSPEASWNRNHPITPAAPKTNKATLSRTKQTYLVHRANIPILFVSSPMKQMIGATTRTTPMKPNGMGSLSREHLLDMDVRPPIYQMTGKAKAA